MCKRFFNAFTSQKNVHIYNQFVSNKISKHYFHFRSYHPSSDSNRPSTNTSVAFYTKRESSRMPASKSGTMIVYHPQTAHSHTKTRILCATYVIYVFAGSESGRRRTLMSSQMKVTKMLLIVSTVFVVLNMPSYVMRVYAYYVVFY